MYQPRCSHFRLAARFCVVVAADQTHSNLAIGVRAEDRLFQAHEARSEERAAKNLSKHFFYGGGDVHAGV